MFGAIGMIFGSLLGRLIGMLLLIAIGIAVCIVYYVIAARAAMYENVVLFGVPTLPYLFLYFITIDIPLFGGGDWLNVVGIDAEHEIIKLFLVGLPIFFFVAFYLQWKSKIPPLYSLMYSGVCWVASVMACMTVVLIIALVGIYIITKKGGKVMLGAATETTELVKTCPNCHQQIAAGDSYCPHCGQEF